jgi:hypothetical protein
MFKALMTSRSDHARSGEKVARELWPRTGPLIVLALSLSRADIIVLAAGGLLDGALKASRVPDEMPIGAGRLLEVCVGGAGR